MRTGISFLVIHHYTPSVNMSPLTQFALKIYGDVKNLVVCYQNYLKTPIGRSHHRYQGRSLWNSSKTISVSAVIRNANKKIILDTRSTNED